MPATFPRRMEDVPTTGDREAYPGVIEVKHKEGVFVGYRHYDQRRLEPAYPFGHGLSYTSFSYRGLRIRKGRGNTAAVSVEVRNTGRRTGTEVAQLYLGLPELGAGVKQPPRALKGARKLTLRPGQRRRVGFRLDERALSYWNEGARGWRVAVGLLRRARRGARRATSGCAACWRSARACPAPRACLARRSPIGPRNIGRIRARAHPLAPRAQDRAVAARAAGHALVREGIARPRERRVRQPICAQPRPAGGHDGHAATATAVCVRARSAAALRRAYPRLRRVTRGVFRANPSSPRLFGVRRGRVRFIAVASKRLLRSPRSLRRSLARAGL